MDGPRALVAQAVLCMAIAGVPLVEIALIASPNEGCTAGWWVSPVPIAFIVDALLLIPSFIASFRGYRWLRRVAALPPTWRSHAAALGQILIALVFMGSVGWSLLFGWWGVAFVCVARF